MNKLDSTREGDTGRENSERGNEERGQGVKEGRKEMKERTKGKR